MIAVVRPYVIGCVLTYNSSATVLAALLSVANVVNHVIVIGGDFNGNASDDETDTLVDAFAAHVQGVGGIEVTRALVSGPLWVKRQAYVKEALRHVEEAGVTAPCWLFQVDSDEVYDDRVNHLPWLLSQLPSEIVTIGWPMHLFTRDLEHEEQTAIDAQVRAYRLVGEMQFRHMAGGLEELIDARGAPMIAEGCTHWTEELAVFHYHRHLSLRQKEQKVWQYLTWQGLAHHEAEQQLKDHSIHYERERWLQECVLPRQWRPEEHPWALREAERWKEALLAGAPRAQTE